MEHKTCIITGANTGLGLATSESLAKKGWQVVMVGRSEKKLQKAKEAVVKVSSTEKVSLQVADFSSLTSVRDLGERLNQTYPELHVLVNNAGAFFTEYQVTEDGFERQWQINHLAPFLLTQLVMGKLKKSAPARIVNVSSNAHYKGTIRFSDPNLKQKYSGYYAYAQSKLANVLFAYELARRLEVDQVTANCLHPGVVDTGIGNKNSKGWISWAWRTLRPMMIGPEKGAATQVYLASSPEVAKITGKYFVKSKEQASSQLSYQKTDAQRLWEFSWKQVGLDDIQP